MVDQVKLAHMEWCQVWEPSIPSDVSSDANRQQLIWGYPGVAWTDLDPAPLTLATMGVGR